MRKTLRIFISSPGDVPEERLRAHLVVQKLARDYQRFFKIEPYLWEYEPMLASGHFQDAIEPPSKSDIVVLVVYSRLGTALPQRTAAREYRGIDGRSPVTGTEWEFEDALEAHQTRGAPDLLAYRKLGDPQTSLADVEKRVEQERQWQALETFWARHFEGAGVFLAGSAKFQSLEEFDSKLEGDLVRLIEARIAQGLRGDPDEAGDATWLHGSPFPGLAAYDFRDAPIFFGRDAQIRAASTRLQAAAAGGTAFLLVLGASGSGKSSLARAGILPALFAAKAVPKVGLWRRTVLRPAEGGEDPVLGLARALAAGKPQDGEGLPELLVGGMRPEELAAHLRASSDDPSFPFRQALALIAAEGRAKRGLLPHEEARLVILVDQIEELFTRDIDLGQRALFVRILAGLARSGVVWIVATVRNDLWHRAAEIPQLVALVEQGARLDLPAPDGAEIIEIVRRPAAAAGIAFEKDPESGTGLDAVISRAAAEEPGALPLMSVLLQSLFTRDILEGGGHSLTFAGYRALGELKGAIARRAEQALAGLATRDSAAAAALPQVLRALVTASEDGTPTSRPARLDAFPDGGPEARLVAALLAPDVRLLVASERDGMGEIRLAHEALIDNWPTARAQVAADRRDLETRARLETLQRRWSGAATPAERKRALLTSLNLAEGTDLVGRWGKAAGDGLSGYVSQSETADRWHRRAVMLAAACLVLVFAGIAGVASLQWRRADQQTQIARAAEETERDARASADKARNDALRERDRADAERAKALAALRDAKRNAARSLAAQANLAADRSEIHRSLTIAAQAGEIERDVLDPGEPSASQPALLKALAGNREAFHLDRQKGGGHTLPHDFFGDDKLVYADMQAGIMLADLPTRSVVRLATLPVETLPLFVRSVPALGLVVVTSVKNVFIVEVESRRVRARIPFDERIGALEVNEAGRVAVIGTGSGISFIPLDAPVKQEIVQIPNPKRDFFVGQIRSRPGARKVLVSYGVQIYEFDRDTGTFGAPLKTELVAESAGFNRDLSEQVAAQALMVLVEMRPDADRNRMIAWSQLSLTSIRADGTRYDFDRETPDTVLGVGFTGPDDSGDVMSIIGRRGESGIDIRLSYISEDKKALLFETFRVSAADLNSEQLQSCKLTRRNAFLACTYNGKNSQGIYVWRVLGGNHRGARLSSAIGPSSSGAILAGPTPRLLAADRSGLSILPGGTRLPNVAWNETWRLGQADGAYVAAAAPDRVQVFRQDGAGLSTALAALDGQAVRLRGDVDRALVSGTDRLTLYDLTSGKPLWAIPGLPGLRAAELSADGSEVVALAGDQAYVFDGRTGRIVTSVPFAAKPGSAVGIDPQRRKIVAVTEAGVVLFDIASGSRTLLAPDVIKGAPVVQIASDLSAGRIVLGLGDGRVTAVEPGGALVWTLTPPADETFEVASLPGHEPRGTIILLAISPGGRLAIVRQDMPTVDLHEVSSGQFLTQLSAPWMQGIAATVAFDREDRVATAWALHAILRTKPTAVAFHALPLSREDALAAVHAALASAVPVAPDGSARPVEPVRSN